MEGRTFVLLVALVVVALSFSACSSSIDISTPGRAPPAADDFVVNVEGTLRGFGKAKLSRDSNGPIVFAEFPEMAISARIRLPSTASNVSCLELPNGIVLSTSSPVEHGNASYVTADWSATECSIVVSRIDATATKGAEGSFSGTLVREKDEVGGKTINGPKSLNVTAPLSSRRHPDDARHQACRYLRPRGQASKSIRFLPVRCTRESHRGGRRDGATHGTLRASRVLPGQYMPSGRAR